MLLLSSCIRQKTSQVQWNSERKESTLKCTYIIFMYSLHFCLMVLLVLHILFNFCAFIYGFSYCCYIQLFCFLIEKCCNDKLNVIFERYSGICIIIIMDVHHGRGIIHTIMHHSYRTLKILPGQGSWILNWECLFNLSSNCWVYYRLEGKYIIINSLIKFLVIQYCLP